MPKGLVVAANTKEFLTGKYANAADGNSRLLKAVCEMHARAYSLDFAGVKLLLAAGPWDRAKTAKANATIRSAYSSPHNLGRK